MSQPNSEALFSDEERAQQALFSDEERAQQVPLVDTHQQQQEVLTHWMKGHREAQLKAQKRKQHPSHRLHPLLCKGLAVGLCVLIVYAVLHISTVRWVDEWHHKDVPEKKDHEVDKQAHERVGNEDLCKPAATEGLIFPVSFEGPVGSCPEGWTCTGAETQICALGSKTRVCNHPGIDNVEGTHYFNVGNDMGTGSATSAVFMLPKNVYSVFFRRSGGADEGSGVYIIRKSDDEVICAAEEGQNSNVMVEQWCNNVRKYAGEPVFIVIKDAQQGDWGKVLVDNFRLLDKNGNDLNPEINATDLSLGQDESSSKHCFLKKSGYISPGGDIFAEKTTPKAAKAKCRQMQDCCGITHEDSPEAAANMPVPVYFKGVCDPGEHSWQSYYLERTLDEQSGVEALLSSEMAGGHGHHEGSHHSEPIMEVGEVVHPHHGTEGAHGSPSHDAHNENQQSEGHAGEHGGHESHGIHVHGHEVGSHGSHGSHGNHGGHGGHGGHGHEGVEMVSKVAVDQAVAAMLLGSIAFHTSLFYLVNFNDDDMKRHSWSVLSSTIAIFSAVLVFKGFKGVMKYIIQLHLLKLFTVEQEGTEMIMLGYVEVFIFFSALQFVIYKVASAESKEPDQHSDHELDLEQRMTCWSTILAHMSAFAAMDAGVQMQMTDTFKAHPLLAFVPVLITVVLLFIIFRVADHIRAGCSRFGCPHDVLLKWDEVSEEGENDFGGLGISYLLSEAIKYNITGEFTRSAMSHHHHNLAVRPQADERLHEVVLFFIGLAFAALSVLVVWLREQRYRSRRLQMTEGGDEEVSEEVVLGDFNKYLKRWFFICQTTFAMCFAWCLLSTLAWTGAKMLDSIGFFFGHHTTGQHAVVALAISFLAFCLIRILDLIEDMEATGEVTDKCTRSMIDSLAILIGFSWEHSFNVGVKVLAELTREKGDWCPVVAQFALACAVALVVIPAWRLYILKMVLKLRKEKKEEKR